MKILPVLGLAASLTFTGTYIGAAPQSEIKLPHINAYHSRVQDYIQQQKYGHALGTLLQFREAYPENFSVKAFGTVRDLLIDSALLPLSIEARALDPRYQQSADFLKELLIEKLQNGIPGLKYEPQQNSSVLEVRILSCEVNTTQTSEAKQKNVKVRAEVIANPDYILAKGELERAHAEFLVAQEAYLKAKGKTEEKKSDTLIGSAVGAILTGDIKSAVKTGAVQYGATEILGAPSLEDVHKAEEKYKQAQERLRSVQPYLDNSANVAIPYEEVTVRKHASIDLSYRLKQNNLSKPLVHGNIKDEKTVEDLARQAVLEAGILSDPLNLPSDEGLCNGLIPNISVKIGEAISVVGERQINSYAIRKSEKKDEMAENYMRFVVLSSQQEGKQEVILFLKEYFKLNSGWLELSVLLNG